MPQDQVLKIHSEAARALRPDLLLSQKTRLGPTDLPYAQLPSPAEVLDLRFLEDNLGYLQALGKAAGVEILLAQKAYSLFATYPLIARYLRGTSSSGLYEAKLAAEHFPGGIIQVYSPAYKQSELEEILSLADYVIFNSPEEWLRWRSLALEAAQKREELRFGLRINPEFSAMDTDLYNPAAPGSRLGTTIAELERAQEGQDNFWYGLSGLHVHCLCEEGAEELAGLVNILLDSFADYLPRLEWLNLGGGHHFTRRDYHVPLFLATIKKLKKHTAARIFLEPGEAIPLDCGWLVTRVLDLPYNEMRLAILDSSATCHMPDVLEMPYRPRLFKVEADGSQEAAGEPREKAFTYRLGGPSCLAGDIMGDYSFDQQLVRDDVLAFCDMSLYSHVKRTSFNGMPLPDLYTWDGKQLECLRHFTYQDFKNKLGNSSADKES
ncbi:MAG: carboxynorspermidine decarboxylase [Eubacteriales bacterium]|nr:carboxynorspermidine decarboxylase [Eubacteriales bacterium]